MAQAETASKEQATSRLVLTHGTLEIRDVRESMRFYRDFLGLDVVQHVPFGCRISAGGPWYVVCLEVKREHDMSMQNHFGFDCATQAEVDAWYERALAEKEKYDLVEVKKPYWAHGAYSLRIKDRDRNWWEIEYYEGEDTNLRWGQQLIERVEARKQRQESAARP
jgi:catechol 2,3-dioxygenase-like lactoylglutathione lyase family enzyme